MINKYQQGGAAPQQGGVLAQIQQLPREQQEQLMQAFAQWAQQKGVDIQQLQSNPAALEQALGQFMQEMQAQQAQAAKHGAKLRYIKNLKHQCPEGEHLEYFAKGGAVGCNCVKNKEGGKAEPKKNALEQFKSKKGIDLKKDKCGGKMKKHQIGGTIETLRQSLGLEKKKFVTKHQQGGTVFEDLPIERQLRLREEAHDLVPNGWGGATDMIFEKYLKTLGIQRRQQPTLEDVLSAEEGMKTPRTRNEFIRQNNLPSDYFTTDNNTRAKYNDEWRKRKALTLPKKPELYPGSKDVPQPVTVEYPLPPIQFDLSEIPGYQEGGNVEKSDNTKVQKPIPGIIDKNSEVRTYDGYPLRVNKNYPQQDKYQLEAPTRKQRSPFGGKMNVKYPWVYGVELTSLGPEYIQKISNNDTTYYTRGYDNKYYRVAGQELRPIFRELFK